MWFTHAKERPYVVVNISRAHATAWIKELGVPLRRCYVSDAQLRAASKRPDVSMADIVASKLPDPGSVMSGDFGEFVAYLYQASRALPRRAVGPKKWGMKQDRTAAAPHSDVVQFVLPSWPQASVDDELFCAEVKAKATNGNSTPIASAIAGSEKDRTSRLAKTLIWLRDRSITEDLGEVNRDMLERFIDSTGVPPARKIFRAIAVLCESVSGAELQTAPSEQLSHCSVIVIIIPDLYATYSGLFEAAHRSVEQS